MQKVHQFGSVELEAVYGDETTIVNCARVSTSKTVVDELHEEDLRLLDFLAVEGHGTPFEHVLLRFRVRLPIFVARQWMRHRIGTFNEYSQRYRESILQWYTPDDLPDDIKSEYNLKMFDAAEFYHLWYNTLKEPKKNARLREMLRCALPVSFYTEFIWSVNLRSLMNFIYLRCADDAQLEIRQYADAVLSLAQEALPNIKFKVKGK